METIIICRKEVPPHTTYCQLHGEPIEHDGYTQVSFIMPSGKVRQERFHKSITNEKILEILKSHPKNLKDYNFEFKNWNEIFNSNWINKLTKIR